ncbi:unnamed protein product [Orchesella dallaii]|uniref:Uncharacterized protein n=1 Tax=Orchesella dallaii TaxID=48710 RepID=A0ABP1RCF2_9HEXA
MLNIVVPIFLFAMAYIRIRWSVSVKGRVAPALTITLDGYKDAISLFHESSDYSESIFRSVLGSSAQHGMGTNLAEDLLEVNAVRDSDYHYFRNHYIIGLATNTGPAKEVRVYFSTSFFHAAPLAMNIYANTILKKMDMDRKITVVNHPFQHPYFNGPEYHHDPYAPGSILTI